jgi:S-adenosylmethionine:tRNA ribosyltransferase-isomerase
MNEGFKAAYEYDLPEELIAQEPAQRRDQSRLLLLPRSLGVPSHHQFSELPDLLSGDELLVVNDTRVVPARLWGRKPSGGRVELLLLGPFHGTRTEALLKASKATGPGTILELGLDQTVARVRVEGELGEGRHALELLDSYPNWLALALAHGAMPLPPYIKRAKPEDEDRTRYQTLFAARDGAVAAPTAGLHFTPPVLAALEARGVQKVALTLHVGLGTFLPLRVEDLAQHQMHSEHYEVSEECARAVNEARRQGRPVLAVGTTVVRALESAAGEDGVLRAGAAETRIFLRPPCNFKVVDALLTNFHLPESTLLMLVSAFAGRERVLAAYGEAVANRYRFFSYGDCMLIR